MVLTTISLHFHQSPIKLHRQPQNPLPRIPLQHPPPPSLSKSLPLPFIPEQANRRLRNRLRNPRRNHHPRNLRRHRIPRPSRIRSDHRQTTSSSLQGHIGKSLPM